MDVRCKGSERVRVVHDQIFVVLIPNPKPPPPRSGPLLTPFPRPLPLCLPAIQLSNIVRNSLDPTWECAKDTFVFPVTLDQVVTRHLVLTVWDSVRVLSLWCAGPSPSPSHIECYLCCKSLFPCA